MKRRSLSLFVFGLALTLVMYNCKKSDPLEPDTELVDKINDIEVKPITIVTPAPVTTTPATVTTSAKTAEVAAGVAGIAASGTVPASVKTAAAEVSAAISPAEVATMASVTPATIAAVSAGGALPANLKSVLDKAAANPQLKAYLPTFTLPTVNGQAVGGRQGASAGVEIIAATDGLQVSDECIAKAEEAFQAVKAKLDASKATELANVESAYAAAIAPFASDETSCKAGIPTKYDGLRASAKTVFDATNTALDGAQAVLGSDYALLKALNSISYLGYLSTLNTLQTAELTACTSTRTAKSAAAQAARTANIAAANAAYTTALNEANTVKTDLVKSCHNQGGGN